MPKKDDFQKLPPVKPTQPQSISGFKSGASKPPLQISEATEKKNKPKQGQGGRPRKLPSEKETFVLALKIKDSERAALEDKAGLVPLATYVKHFLRTKTDLLG